MKAEERHSWLSGFVLMLALGVLAVQGHGRRGKPINLPRRDLLIRRLSDASCRGGRTGELVRLMPSSGFVDSAIEELNRIERPRTKEVEVRYILSLFTGSSLASQKLVVFLDGAGDGYFRRGEEFPVYFFSPGLARLLQKQGRIDPGKTAKP